MAKTSGILLHPTSLPGDFGIGDFGPGARTLVDFLSAAGQSLWQVLPLGPTGFGNSPYQSLSAFAGNTLLISPESLAADGLLEAGDLQPMTDHQEDGVDYAAASQIKQTLLKKACDKFVSQSSGELKSDFEEFCEGSAHWLDDYALFRSLKADRDESIWTEWERGLVDREPVALENARRDLRDEIEVHKVSQFLFFKQWRMLRDYAMTRGVRMIGDLPIFVAHDSADVWANRNYFKLNAENNPVVVAGVPPDYFSDTGQLWGNPHYQWDQLEHDGFKWWIDRVRIALEMFDFVRLDHFRGFESCWEVAAGEPDAARGQWVATPGRKLFEALKGSLGELPFIAENLGVITPEVEALRQELGFPGMRVLQFAFSSDELNEHLPVNYESDLVAYTGTHDNDTTTGWFSALDAGGKERKFCLEYLNSDGREIHRDFIRAVLESRAKTVIIPVQDLLGLGSEARMNFPATTEGNWIWRLNRGALTDQAAASLREETKQSGRLPGQLDR